MMRTVLLLLVLLLVSTRVSAQEPAPRAPISEERTAELKTLFAEAQELYKAGRYTEALPKFQQVSDELASPNALLYVARCQGKMGHNVSAYHAMERTRNWATEKAATEPRFEGTAKAAADELAELQLLVGRVTVSVPNMPEGTVVEVAGSVATVNTVVVVEPGTVRVEVRPPGLDVIRREVPVAAGSEQTILIHIVAAPTEAPGPAPDASPDGLGAVLMSGGWVRVAGYVVLGAGAVGWGALAVAGVMSDNKFEEVEKLCNSMRCTSEAEQDEIDRGRELELIANIGLGLGIVGTVAGTLMVLLGGPKDVSAAPSVTGLILPGGGMAAYTMAF